MRPDNLDNLSNIIYITYLSQFDLTLIAQFFEIIRGIIENPQNMGKRILITLATLLTFYAIW